MLFYGGRSAKLCSLTSLKTVKLVYIIIIHNCKTYYCMRSHGVMVSTLDFESNDPSSSLGGTSFFFFFCFFKDVPFNFFQFHVLNFRVDQLPVNDTVTGIWSSLVRLAGSGDGAFSTLLSSSAPPHLLVAPPEKMIMKTVDNKGNSIVLVSSTGYK